MAFEENPRNRFRASVLGGPEPSPVVTEKQARVDRSTDGLEQVEVPRAETRRGNHREGDRHRLDEQQVLVRKRDQEQAATLVNLSGGGAMIEGAVEARLWDRLTLVLGDFGEVECAVRWVRGNRFGLEFAHETRIDCDADTLDETLKEVIRKSFPETAAPAPGDEQVACEAPRAHNRQQTRHPLIWSGLVHHDHETVVARLRNISARGALIESTSALAEGCEVQLDLGNAGTIPATVCWSRGDQAGLSFGVEFDVRSLARSRPEVASSNWSTPDYLRDNSVETSPWASEWGRLTLKELSRSLTG